jgi:pyruvate, orthophosphate dikinase
VLTHFHYPHLFTLYSRGGKGYGLQEMSSIPQISVPPGFTLTTPLCQVYEQYGDLPECIWDKVDEAIERVEQDLGRKFGGGGDRDRGDRDHLGRKFNGDGGVDRSAASNHHPDDNQQQQQQQQSSSSYPLLFSCRSGAKISMPGMMDTVLNVGLNKNNVEGLVVATGGNRRFAYDAYRRLLDMFGDVRKMLMQCFWFVIFCALIIIIILSSPSIVHVHHKQVVLGIPHEAFEAKLQALKTNAGVLDDVDLTADDLEKLCVSYYKIYDEHNKVFPQDPMEQIKACIKAVFGSWNSERAIKYREIHGITPSSGVVGTACNIQAMVFGNLGPTSGTGVAFSRDPGTGRNELKGEYLVNAQGEDVVAGIRTPLPISAMADKFPQAYAQFVQNVNALERHFKDMQDVEFTVENEKLWMLQCRSGKRTGLAAFQIASDMVKEGLLT